MSRYDKNYLERRAQETSFIRDNLEKVLRLVDLLEYANINLLLKESLALKGGTAINLVVFNMPRLSVDLDFDFCRSVTREEMLECRKQINEDLKRYLASQGYQLNPEKSKDPHSLDSWVFWYINAAGNRDNIKIEINYSLREHLFPVKQMPIQTDFLEKQIEIKVLSPIELFASKINALIGRTAARDLYDVNNMIYLGTFDESEWTLLKKSVLFYLAIGGNKEVEAEIDLTPIDLLSWYNIHQSLLPMLRHGERFDLEVAKKRVKAFLSHLLILTPQEKAFLLNFKEKRYCPELLFEDEKIVARIINHPMALWKTRTRD